MKSLLLNCRKHTDPRQMIQKELVRMKIKWEMNDIWRQWYNECSFFEENKDDEYEYVFSQKIS